ncbi:GNAT family N-acetyltransferase [Salarchaeum sp. JOR-1]|uniref:GNAT family N-acetyltransferase n=1 Tax=Salarchaeum sp. JOR-1 TaxID=2599399 RepID=UPI00119859B9|nr:GNAT family N-acetyltransferase [Salarchaeum sp. JOR-1]QDX40063.1 GNAT family N-acetyltransferase [Salarchaeum sp. JOR-1]
MTVDNYPDTASGPFPSPPSSFADGEDRDIELRAFDEDTDALVEMYVDFSQEDRAQGVPPVGEERVRDWLDTLTGDGYNVVAWHGDRVVGHATLVPDGTGGYELAIFVHQAYQGAGIGTRLLRNLLGHGAAQGVERVWLTVERWNRAAVALYEKVGFETVDAESFELEMAIRV